MSKRVERKEKEFHRLNEMVKSYREEVKDYKSRMTIFVGVVEKALKPRGHQREPFKQFVQEVNKTWLEMPRNIQDHRLVPLSSKKVEAFLKSIRLQAKKTFKSLFTYYRNFIDDCLDSLQKEVKRVETEITKREMTGDIRITRTFSQARQMVKDILRRLRGYKKELPAFDELWVAVTEAHVEIRNVWMNMKLNRKVTELEDYLGYPVKKAWKSRARSINFLFPNILNEVED